MHLSAQRDQGSTTHPGATAGAPPPASVREFPQAGPSRVHALGTPNAEGVRAVLYHIRVVAESQVRVPIALARSSSIADVQEVVVDGEAGGDQGAVGTPLRRSTSVPWRAHASGGAPPSGGSAMGEGKPRSFTLWLNLRDTPFVYVKGRPLTVRDAATLFRGASLGAHATAERLEEIEEVRARCREYPLVATPLSGVGCVDPTRLSFAGPTSVSHSGSRRT